MGILRTVDPGDERLADGRQSARALEIQRGTARLLKGLDYSCIFEMTLRSGRRADILAVSASGEILIIEIKSSLEDFRSDRKWPEYRAFCDRLYFATLADVDPGIFPEDAGLIAGDGFDAEILRDAPEHKLAAASRKALLLKVARASCDRLHRLMDPNLGL